MGKWGEKSILYLVILEIVKYYILYFLLDNEKIE